MMKRLQLWVLPILVAVALLLTGNGLSSAPGIETQVATGPDNIIIVPVQVGRDAYGLAMVDTIGKTMWIYEVNSRLPSNRLRLLAARNWEYDQLLQDYNTGEPKPRQVRELLEKLNVPRKARRDNQQELEELAQPGIE
ncbi:MAG: hypothetical protein ACYTFK_08655 [Planctomycetota bacterium]|jgi:hypothetical protein